MKEHSTITTASGPELSQTDAAQNVKTQAGSTEATAPAAADPLVATGVEQIPLVPGAGASPKMSSSPTPMAASTNVVVGDPEPVVAKPVVKIIGIQEIVRSKTGITSWKPPFEAAEGSESGIQAIVERAESVRSPLDATPVPTGTTPYGTTDELFTRLQEAIAAQTFLPTQTSSLLTYWTISTWFSDGLSLAPGLVIVAPEFEGDRVLRTLRSFCRYPLMLTRAEVSSLKKVNWYTTPTLLFYDPNVTKQMATILGCTTSRSYMVGDADGYKDFYGPKAIYVGEEVSVDRIPRSSLQVRLQPTAPASATQHSLPLTEAAVQNLQNQLLRYRLKNLVKVYHSDFDASALTSDTRAVANALGACIVDSPELQSKLVSLLRPIESQRQADRSTCIEAVTLEATLNLCHQSKAQILVGEIATEVNRIAQARGERLHYSAETIGHRLKKVGLSTRRLGKAGKGLAMDLATMARIHELASVYGDVGLEQDENNLHCPLCTENKCLM
jgi:hypothetical protein